MGRKMTTAIERAMNGAETAPLTKKQRQLLMARYVVRAWNALRKVGLAGDDLEAWRREENFKACHKTHLRAATQADWPLLCAHFLRLVGRTEEARAWELRSAGGGLAVARQKLRQAMAETQDVIERPDLYAAAIARSKFNTLDLASLSARQTWVLVFDLRRGAQKRRAHGTHGTTRNPPPPELRRDRGDLNTEGAEKRRGFPDT